MHKWTVREDTIIRDLFPLHGIKAVYHTLKYPPRSKHAISHRATLLKVRLAPELPHIVEHLTEVEKAYIAGAVDADGSIYINPRPIDIETKVYVASICTETIDWLHKRVPLSFVFEPSIKSNPLARHRIFWWVLAGPRRVAPFLRALMPYLITKRAKAQQVLDKISNVQSQRYVQVSQPKLEA